MKTRVTTILLIAALVIGTLTSCEKEEEITTIKNIEDVNLKVTFSNTKAINGLKSDIPITKETPINYFVALKSAKLLGQNGTSDFELFNEPDLSSSFVFDYTDENTVHSLLKGQNIPEGDYSAIKIEIYYLQMNIAIATRDRGVERRNLRIYLSDDAETEGGLHQRGDLTQINNGQEIGWLLGEGQMPNMDPVAPRTAAYTHPHNGAWYNFAGKNGKDYGPFGDMNFANNSPHPIYHTTVNFNLSGNGTNLVLNFNVKDCWQFEDKSGDGVFGAADIDPIKPTKWHMELPEMTTLVE